LAIAPETAFAIAAEAATAATVVAITVAIGLAHHRRGTFLVFVDTNAEVADHVFADPLLPLDLGDRGRRTVDVQKHEMRLAILVHAVGEGTYAPVFRLDHLAAELLDDAGHLGGQFLDLLGARVLTREKNMLIKRHGCPFQCWRGRRRQALRTLGKDSICSEGGSTGRRTYWSCHINIAKKVRLLRPSVQLPAGDPRMARFIRILAGMARESGPKFLPPR